MRQKNRVIALFLALLIMFGLFPNEIFKPAHAATRTRYAYLISGILVTVTRKSDNVIEVADGSVSWGADITGSWPWKVTMTAKTLYPDISKISYGSWKNEEFEFVDVYPAKSSNVSSPALYFVGNAPNYFATTARSLSAAMNTKAGSYTQIIPDDSYSPDLGSKEYMIDFTLKSSDLPSVGKTKNYAVMSIFEYVSVNELPDPDEPDPGPGPDPDPDPDPDPEPPDEPDEPSVARITGNLPLDTPKYINYKTFKESKTTITATATAQDTSQYNDIGSFSNMSMSLNGLGDTFSDTTTNRSISGTLTGEASINSTWLDDWSPIQYVYTIMGSAQTKLTAGDPSSAKINYNVQGEIRLTNEEPKVTVDIQTADMNGGSVPKGYFYTNTPINFNVTFSDPENDIRNVAAYIGTKADMDSNIASLIYQNDKDGNETFFNAEHQIEVQNVVKTLNGFSATLIIKQPGLYAYTAYLNDLGSDDDIWAYIGKSDTTDDSNGVRCTFVVKGDPEPPTALITSPAFAFENEPFNVTQASTDPNGVEDILTYTWTPTEDSTADTYPDVAAQPGFAPITNVTNSWPGNGTVDGKNGGKLTFPTGSAHHTFHISLTVKDATNLTDTMEQDIKVISNVPVAVLKADTDTTALKENRKVVISASDSIAPKSDPIQWDKAVWTIEAVKGGTADNIHEDDTQRDGNKQRVLQFDKPGTYKVTLKLTNNFATQNPTHEDIEASTITYTITVVEDRAPISNVIVTSEQPSPDKEPGDHTISFRVTSYSDDGDIITAPTSYNWVLYEDVNNDNQYTDDEIIPAGRLTFNAEKTEVSVLTTYEEGRHTKVKAEVTTTESFAEPFIQKFLAADGSYIRKTTVSTIEVVNWPPKIYILPPDASSTTPYEDTDIDGDTIMDGKFIRAYTDDTFSVGTKIVDEFPDTCNVTWELYKKDHSGAYQKTEGSGSQWINSSNVFHTLGHDGGSVKITSPGIYMLKAIVRDDSGSTAEATIMIRIYTLPIAVLETNPTYLIDVNNAWKTKENIRFDLRSNPTIIDDEWGKAWHTMDWSKDCWDVRPLEGQSAKEIHFMNPEYTARYDDLAPSDETVFSGRNSPLGKGQVTSTQVDIIMMTGLIGEPTEDNKYALTTTQRAQMESYGQQLVDKLRQYDSRYNVKFYTARAAEESMDTFRTPITYGYFDGFNNTQTETMNMYTKEYSTVYENGGVGSIGTTTLTGDIAKINRDDKGRECQFGTLTLMAGYDPDHEDTARGKIFTGSAKFYCNDVILGELDDTTNWSSSVQVATMKREGDSWVVTGINGSTVTVNESTDIKTKVEFTGNASCNDYLAIVTRGWCGIYYDESYNVTHPKEIMETLSSLNLRPSATKILIFATNNYKNPSNIEKPTIEDIAAEQMLLTYDTSGKPWVMPEMVAGTNNGFSDEAIALDTNLKNYLISNQIHFMGIEQGGMLGLLFRTENFVPGTVNGLSHTYNEADNVTFILNDVYDYILAHTTLTGNDWYRSCSFTEPGMYSITYWGTNYGGKTTKPVTYPIEVIVDEPPVISGEVISKFLRDPSDPDPNNPGKFRATIALTGPYSEKLKKDVLTVTSPDGDYIDYTKIKVVYDSNNNKIFETTDLTWAGSDGKGLAETTGTQLTQVYNSVNYYLYYTLKKLN